MKKAQIRKIDGLLALVLDLQGLEDHSLREGDEIEVREDANGLYFLRAPMGLAEITAAYEVCRDKYGETLRKLAE
jgi:hypothetical protein